MDDRIIHNPHLEAIPDHAGPHYDVLRNILIQTGMTPVQVVEALNNSWTQNHSTRIQAWDQQEANDQAALLEQQQVQQQNQPQILPEPLVEEEAGVEKKKAKMKDFNDAITVGNYIAPRPAQYALR